VRIGISALRACNRNTKITSETIASSSISARRSVEVALRISLSGRRWNDLDARRQTRLQLFERRFRVDHRERAWP
jgi:hypothetical protein